MLTFDPEALPRRIVLSRKGSDSAWGGRPSLRVGDELISLPIPESAARRAGDGLRYGDLPVHARVGALHGHLRDVGADRHVHLDPDVRPELRAGAGWRGAARHALMFGQEGAAERHLRNQGVGPGDLFLFFGWFRGAVQRGGVWKRTGPDEHCIWGWLQVEDSYPVTGAQEARELRWAAHHPHVARWELFDRHNRLYRARRRLSFAPELPGAGVFRWQPGLTLSQRCVAGATRREWCLPGFFRQTGLTYNQVDGPRCPEARGRVHVRSAAIGQEFVLPAHRPFRASERGAVAKWLAMLFGGAAV